MRKIPLSMREDGLCAGFVRVSDCDFDELSQYDWHLHRVRDKFYAVRYTLHFGRQLRIYMHRWILGVRLSKHVDHIDGDGLNNERENLRACTRSQNLMNRGKASHNTSGFKGVWLARDKQAKGHKKIWNATITAFGRRIHLGSHESPELAHAAYVKAAKELHGDFAHA